ncbi:antigen WC1.1 [Engraulis encrasicolus]|uniref:antigen WC1.1 n=1 Tax=Engraulis encrasicolus TaxID=184585 RepID=UPI002FCF6647
MLFLLLYLHSALAQNRLMLFGTDNPCSGRVDIHDGGQWKHVGNKGWTDTNSQVVCKSLRCGEVHNTITEYIDDRNLHESTWAQNLRCSGKEENLWTCGHDKTSQALPKQHVYVTCSKRPKLSLDKQRCAGFVKLTTDRDYTLCAADESAKQQIGEKVCKELNCGEPTSSPNPLVWGGGLDKTKYNCVGDEKSLWRCIDWSSSGTCVEPVSVTCTHHFHFRLRGDKSHLCSGDLQVFGSGEKWEPVTSESFTKNFTNWSPKDICDQMDCGGDGSHKINGGKVSLSCSDNVTMALEGGTCHGTIYLQRNTEKTAVCYADEKIGQIACKEMECGGFIKTYQRPISGYGWKLSCKDHAQSLWHCQRSQASCGQQSQAIMCSDSYKVRLRDGLDECSGRVEVQYQGSWRKVQKTRWDKGLSDRVCKDLGCGESHKDGSGIFIDGTDDNKPHLQLTEKCAKNVHILKCLTESTSQQKKEFIDVICQGHHLFFVRGNSHCSGTVEVEQAGVVSLLSGEPESWDDAAAKHVCERMHCGGLISHSSKNQTTDRLMQLSLNDTSGRRYTLQQASANSGMVATVNCAGNVSVMLKNNRKGSKEATKDRCWGYVEVCRGGKCGGVCRDVWKHSEKLCSKLGCGRPVNTNQDPRQSMEMNLVFNSIHCPDSDSVSDLGTCTGVSYNHSCTKAAYVTCSGSLMAKLDDPRDKCAGNAKVYLEGQWLPLCGSVEKDIQNSVCNDVGCGVASSLTMATPDESSQGLTVTCEKGSMSMESCTTIQYNTAQCSKVAKVKCSSWRRLVVFSRKSYCDGPVSVKTDSNLFPVPSHTWGENSTEAKSLCSNLGCSGPGTFSKNDTRFNQWWNKTYSCQSQNIWDCEREAQEIHQQQLYVHCEGQKQVTLSDECYGEVMIDSEKVCSNGWTDKMSEMVCDNLRCGAQYSYKSNSSSGDKLRQFDCTGEEARLMQCSSWTPKVCSGGGAVSVMCRNAFNFSLTHHCGGQFRVFQHGEWQAACVNLNDGRKTANLLCQKLKCGNYNSSKEHHGKPESQKTGIQTVLSCQDKTELERCVQRLSCGSGYEREIYCDGFVDIFPPPELPINLIVGVTVGLLLLVIIIVLVLWQRKRITKLLRGLSRTTTTVTSEDIEQPEIVSLKDGIEMRLQNQANGREKVPDSQSQVSSEYDDVAEDSQMEVASPVTSQDEDAPPLPERDMEQDGESDDDDDDDGDDGEGYDDVAEPEPAIEEEEEEERRALPPSPLQETRALLEEEEDYIEPDNDP